MGGKVLKRELESYEKAYQKYLAGVKDYNVQSKAYNKQVEYYNASFVTDENGNKLVYSPQNELKAVTPEGKVVAAKLPKAEPVLTTTKNQYGQEVQQYVTPQNPYEPIQGQGFAGMAKIPQGVITMDVGGGYKAAKLYEVDQPGEQPAQPAPISMQAPDPTKAQLQKMNQPSWSDIERGLIGQVITSR